MILSSSLFQSTLELLDKQKIEWAGKINSDSFLGEEMKIPLPQKCETGKWIRCKTS